VLRHLSTACIYWCIGSCSSWLCLQQLALSCSLRPSAWPLYEQNGLLCTKTWQSRSAPRRVDEPANDLFWHNVKLDSSVLCYHVRNVLYQLCIFSWMYITYSVDRYLFFNNTLLHNLAIIAVLLVLQCFDTVWWASGKTSSLKKYCSRSNYPVSLQTFDGPATKLANPNKPGKWL